jgi:hypothetical protein
MIVVAPSRLLFVPMAATAMLLAGASAAAPQFTSYRHDPATILEGHWQSCPEPDGGYAERVYDHVVNGVGQFEVHLGPHNEFAIFTGVQDDHRSHASSDNLLTPYRIVMQDGRASHHWTVPSLNLRFTVTLAGGSFADCDSWYILLEPAGKPS